MCQLLMPIFGSAKKAEHIKFLYEQRLALFNKRRDHEWKIYFGAMILLGSVDFIIATGDIVLNDLWQYIWVLACAIIFIIVFGYESRLQIRNKKDRKAMDELYNLLCDIIEIPNESSIREKRSSLNRCYLWSYYGWAFPWQIILLLLAVAASASIPFLIDP